MLSTKLLCLLRFKSLFLIMLLSFHTFAYCKEKQPEQTLHEIVSQQQKMLERQQQEISELRNLLFQKQDRTEGLPKKTNTPSNKVTINKKGLRVKSVDGDFSFRAGGRLHADYAYYDDDITPLGSGASLRRARLYFKGKLFKDWGYKAELDFADGRNVGPRAVWLGYKGWKPVSFKVGNFQEYFSLEEMTSSNAITFMERSLSNTFAPSYHLGIGANSSGEFWSLSAGLFGENIRKKDDDVDDGWAVSGRATFAPFLLDKKLLHIGFSSEYRETDTNNELRIRAKPESRVTGRRLVDTRTIDNVEGSLLLGGEIAASHDAYSLQAEYIYNRVLRDQTSDLSFNGGYVQGSWFLTGESRPYNVKQGTFSLINPQHNYGAWEIAMRYSWIDLDDRDINGGKENNITLGINWYVNYNVRFMMNYIFVDAQPNQNRVDETANILQLRGQLVF